ncbi:2,3-dihydro-2,3-dihydroxybenzoate dehydrogenase [Kineosporia sp. NBRC 101731]|uniref:2,3-dihydro-2,3-dihydroxybenzoate dehydrogenase n=1 Tax=Kineosporia sp. NBRC 101731 TaxID=3032199 RepID=UPI003325F64E
MTDSPFRARSAFVTGAAGGIGSVVAQTLAALGTRVAAVDHDADRLEEFVGGLTSQGLWVEALQADLTDAKQVEHVVSEAERRLGPTDYLVNGAGVLHLGQAHGLTDDEWAHTFDVNVTGTFHVCRAVVNRMLTRRRGAVVTIASNAAQTPRTGMAAYAASKAAAAMYTKCLGLEVAGHGIRCNVVAPGSTHTPMLTGMWHDESGRQETLGGRLDTYRLGIPLGKLALPQDIAEAVVFLLSDRAGHITLQTLTVDGGATLGV